MSKTTRRAVLGAGIATGAAIVVAPRARAETPTIKVGVLTDMTGAYAANSGAGSVLATKLGIDDFLKTKPGFNVELVSADLLLKPDVALAIAGDWWENQGVDVIMDVPLSSAALAMADIAKARDRLAIFTGAASAVLTGAKCGPNHLHWAYDTWSMPHGTVDAVVQEGGNSWFFITADYAFGHALETDAAAFVVKAGGKVVGTVRAPFPGLADFSPFIVQAQASGAKVIGLANGGNDAINCIKQAHEFGLLKGGQKIAGMLMLLNDIHGIGLDSAQGVLLSEPFYWNLNEGTRAFGLRYQAQMSTRAMPNSVHGGQYSAVTHYLKAVQAMGVDRAKTAGGRAMIAQMRALPISDPIFGTSEIRPDGRVIHPMYLFEVKTPAQSKEPWDYYTLRRTIPIDQAFRPIADGKCPMVAS
jgi:branched-chain amino acid transport system substrate-binding protein